MKKCLSVSILVALCPWAVSGCKSTSATSGSATSRAYPAPTANEQSLLRARAMALWNAKVAEDWEKVFEFEDPTSRTGWVKSDFVNWSKENEPFKIRSFKISDVQAAGDMGWVEVEYNTLIRRFPTLPPRDAQLWQKWRRVNGSWHPVPLRELVSYPEPPVRRNAVEEANLRARFMDSWRFRKAGDHHNLYQLIDPSDQPRMPEEAYVDMQSLLEYRTCDVNWVEVVGELGRVHATYTRKVTDPSLSKLPIETVSEIEEWVKVNGAWYRDLARGSVATPGEKNDAS